MKIGKYQLVRTTIRLRGGAERTIYFFASTGSRKVMERIVTENVRMQTIDDEKVARAFVDLLDLSPTHAAAVVAQHKAEIERLTPQETDAVRERLVRALLSEESS